MKKFFLTGIALSSLLAGPAIAADLPPPRSAPVYSPPPPPPPPPVVVNTWSSCYVGGEGGGLWVRKKWVDNEFGSLGSHDASGWLAGVRAGCDWQFSGG